MKQAFYDFLQRPEYKDQVISDSQSSYTYSDFSKHVGKLAFLSAHCGVGPGALCLFRPENNIFDLAIIFALFRLGAIAVPLMEGDEATLVKQLGICFRWNGKKWEEIQGIEPYFWKRPPGPGIIFEEEGEFTFHSEKQLVESSLFASQRQSLTQNSSVYYSQSFTCSEGLLTQLLPAIVSGANVKIDNGLYCKNENIKSSKFTHTYLSSDQLNQISQDNELKKCFAENFQNVVLNFRMMNHELIKAWSDSEMIVRLALMTKESGLFTIVPVQAADQDWEQLRISLGSLPVESEICEREGTLHLRSPNIGSKVLVQNDLISLEIPDWVDSGHKSQISGDDVYIVER